MTITQVTYPLAPSTTKRNGSLLDAANVTDDFAWMDEGTPIFDSFNCMRFEEAPAFCAPNAKTFNEGVPWQYAIVFGAYGGVQCRAVGLDKDRLESEVRRVFESNESVAVERALLAERFVENLTRWGAAPTDLTPAGGAVCAEIGVALLEGHAASQYAGVPTIHMPVTIASYLTTKGDAVQASGTSLRTELGSKVAAGGGYDYPNLGPDGLAPAAGEKWLYATGEVLVGRGPVSVISTVDMTNNDVYALAERPYIAVVDCYTSAVRVQVECS